MLVKYGETANVVFVRDLVADWESDEREERRRSNSPLQAGTQPDVPQLEKYLRCRAFVRMT